MRERPAARQAPAPGAARPTPHRAAAAPLEARPGPALSACACGGGCARCSGLRDLVIGAQDSPAERTADAMAARATSGLPVPPGGPPQAVTSAAASPEDGLRAPDSVANTLHHAGTPLDPGVRADMEQRLGRDLGAVRLHLGPQAQRSARDVAARAYTVGSDIVFAAGTYAPGTSAGKKLLAHELAHATQADAGRVLRRTPAAPLKGADKVPFDRSVVNVNAIPDIDASPPAAGGAAVIAQSVSVSFSDPNIVSLAWEFYDPSDAVLPGGFATAEKDANATTAPFLIQNKAPSPWTPAAGRHLVRCIGRNKAGEGVAYADRIFYLWTTKPTGKPPDIAALTAEKKQLDAIVKKGSGKSFGEVGAATTRLKEVTHELAILETGTGVYVGNQCAVPAAGATPTDCTNIVLEVLGNVFAQQGRTADWDKVKKQYALNTTARGGTGLSGLDVQAALQSQAGWKGVFWAPDPAYQIPKAELDHARPDEANFTSGVAKSDKTYYKGYNQHPAYPGVAVDQRVINYAPEKPTDPAAPASTATVDTTQLAKLKKLPFGVLSAHGGQHMTLIAYGKVVEVHWDKAATDATLIEQTDLENWAVGPRSGYHYYASGAIVAPAADIAAAFK
jgi:hypothetical protein